MKGQGGARRFTEGLAAVNGLVAVALFSGLTLVVALQVFTRFVLHAPFIWSEELARFLFFWVVLLGSSLSVRQRRHFVIDVTTGGTLLPERGPRTRSPGRFLLDLIPDLCVLGFSVLLFVQGIGYAEVGLLRVGPNSQVNMAVVYAAIPVFAALSVLYSLGHLVTDSVEFCRERAGEGPGSGAGGSRNEGGMEVRRGADRNNCRNADGKSDEGKDGRHPADPRAD